MSDYIISTDAGNGGTNAIMAKPNGGFKSHYIPSVRASATGETLGLGKDMELQYEYIDWNGHRYVAGDDVIRITRRNLERLAEFATFADARAQAEAIPVKTITPWMEDRGGEPWLMIPDDAGYPVPGEPLSSAARA